MHQYILSQICRIKFKPLHWFKQNWLISADYATLNLSGGVFLAWRKDMYQLWLGTPNTVVLMMFYLIIKLCVGLIKKGYTCLISVPLTRWTWPSADTGAVTMDSEGTRVAGVNLIHARYRPALPEPALSVGPGRCYWKSSRCVWWNLDI